jgi:hypothetical protein
VNSDLLLAALLATTAQTPETPTAQPQATAAPEAAADAPAAGGASAEAQAEEPAGDGLEEEGEEIVVTGQRQRGAVDTEIPPIDQLNGREIRALGASNLTELLQALAPQTQSGRGRGDGGPVTLLNGRRISGFREIRDIPPEAIQRVDILPEEVALRYGYRADQRVVNIVLRRRFRAVTAEVEGGLATEGGRPAHELDLNVLRISGEGRWSVDVDYEKQGELRESERDIIEEGPPRDPAVPSISPFRSLVAGSEQLRMTGVVNRPIGDISATINAGLDITSRENFLGLPSLSLLVPDDNRFSRADEDETLFRYAPAAGPLRRLSDTRNAEAGLALNGELGQWRWSLTSNFSRNVSETRTQTGLDATPLQARLLANDPGFDPFGALGPQLLVARASDTGRSVNRTGNAEAVISGALLKLPAGEVRTTFRFGADTRNFSSRTFRSGIVTLRELGRDRASGQASLDIPIASRRRDFLGAIGNLSVNFNAEVEELSDFGTLTTLGGGLNWSPIDQLSFIASFTEEDGAPSIQQLGDPVLLTPNNPVFDFVRGETVEVTLLEGGNPDLLSDSRRVVKLGANLRPIKDTDLTLNVDYTDTRVRNPISGFPAATAEIEAAFPERFLRDDTGQLLRVDVRPVNFARSNRRELRSGINFSKPIGPQGRQGGPGGPGGGRPGGGQAGQAGQPAQGAQPGQPGQGAQPGQPGQPGQVQGGQAQGRQGAGQGPRGPGGGGFGRGGGGGRFGGFGPGGGGRGGRLQLGLFHTWRFEDSVLIREGVPELDFLGGSAAGGRGGRPQHELQAQAGLFKNGFGAFVSGNWVEGTFVRGGPTGTGATRSDLFFSDHTTVNLRMFANLGQQQSLVRAVPFLRGSRVSLNIDNVFNERLRVRDENGTTPISYQPAFVDPLGRTVRVSFRKLFF